MNEIKKNQTGLWGYGFRKLCQGIDDNIRRRLIAEKDR
jgi:hypothetical protein